VGKRILVFPAGMPRSLAFLDRALSEGQHVVGASSLGHDPARERYPQWTHLPYVTSPEFDGALLSAIKKHAIDGIFTPNPVVWDYLNRFLPRSSQEVTLINSSPVDSELAPYRNALQFGNSVVAQPLELAALGDAKPSVSALEIAALFRHADSIPGMCDHDKIRALCEIFRYCPTGDIVEIGSWWGKSAFVLLRLAQQYKIGGLLCVDPWSNQHLIQNDAKGLVDRIPVSADEALTVFHLNLLPYSNGAINYLRLPSADAALEYQRNRTVTTPVFGSTAYSGTIAILHIDGNHSYENAQADVSSWSSLVKPGGWIIIDDYVWPYGDGPQRVGDDFLRQNPVGIASSFVIGSALFIQLT